MDGTPEALREIAEKVLTWVNDQRHYLVPAADDDTLRRIELCAMSTREQTMVADLYGLHTRRKT